MKKTLAIVLIISLLTNINMQAQDGYYKKAWQEISGFENNGLPKSALKKVDELYSKAKAENNKPQIIKAIIHELKYMQSLEDAGDQKTIDKINKEIADSKFPVKNILYSIKAEAYSQYYRNYEYKILQRSNTLNYKPNDIETFSANHILSEIINNYNLSLSDADKLMTVNKKDFDAILERGTNDKGIFPKLYDFLAYRALQYFTAGDSRLSKSADFFQLNNEKYFANAQEFSSMEVESTDSLSVHYQAVKLFQKWLKLHSADADKKSYTHIDMMRLRFVYNNAVVADKDALYLDALKHLQSENENNKEYSEIAYYLAKYYSDKAKNYNYSNKLSAKFKDYNKKALQISENAMKKYPESFGAKMCEHLKLEILKSYLSFKSKNIVQPKSNFPILIEYKNTKKVYTMIGEIDYNKYIKLRGNLSESKFFNKLKKSVKVVQKYDTELKGYDDYNKHSTELIMKGLGIGTYVICVSNNPEFSYKKNTVSYQLVRVSNLSYIKRNLNNGKSEFCVLNRTTGKPISGVKVKAWKKSYNYNKRKYIEKLFGEYTSNKDGLFYIENSNNHGERLDLELFYKDDYLKSGRVSTAGFYRGKTSINTSYLYTDRAIYRPGQTLHFKSIILNTNGKKHSLLKNEKVKVELYDANYKLLEVRSLTTNEYGSVSGSFTLPNHLLNGRMHLRCLKNNKFFLVEEYKRPKFVAEILPVKGNYILNDLVEVKGKATSYSGAVLTDAQVKYSIVREAIFPKWGYYYFAQTKTQMSKGTVKTNEKGEFTISFKALPDLNYEKNPHLAFNYSITADVTDLNGETQTVSKQIKVGYTALKMGVDISKLLNKETVDSAEIITQNFNGEFLPAKVEMKIYSLKKLKKPLIDKAWASPDEFLYTKNEWKKLYAGNEYTNENDIAKREKDKLLITKQFNTKEARKIDLSVMKSWQSGIYVMELNSVDAFGNKVDYKKYFTLYSTGNSVIPDKLVSWITGVKTECEPGEKAQFLVGSSISDLYLIYEIEHNEKIIKKEIITTNGKQKLVEIPVLEDYRGNFVVHFTFLYKNKIYSKTYVVKVPYTNKHLDITFETFRDKLLPGSEEEWKIKINGYKQDKVAAEMLASMYDASLDKFAKDEWYFDIYQSYYSQLAWKSNIFDVDDSYNISQELNLFKPLPYRNFSSLDWFGTYLFTYGVYVHSKGNRISIRGAATPMLEKRKMKSATYAANKENEKLEFKSSVEDGAIETDKADMSDVKIRSNFSETAFFYPNLQTNANGELTIKFKVPESLTTWNMRGFAYTKNLEFGFINKELKTQKDLMVVPNAPRFFRQNDEIVFPVKISNLSKNKQQGTIRLEFFDALTMKPITDIYARKESSDKSFNVNSQSNTVVSWNLKIPEFNGVIMYKVVAKSGEFSDGEQMVLPVLSNRMLVTESLPLPIRGGETKSFKFNKLLKSKKSQSLKNFKLTLEFSSNPAWYAVQALPYLIENNSECSEQIFARYYANSIANYVANSSPKIKRVFDSWKNTPKSQTLLSNLDKNKELKTALLEETPWVLDAENEQERKSRIALLFDFNKMSNELKMATDKLQKAQTVNGAWPWIEGMPESRYITQYIVAGFGHLKQLGVNDADDNVARMLNRAIIYLDEQIAKDYTRLKSHFTKEDLKKNHLSGIAIHYLYTRSFFKHLKLRGTAKKAFDYYLEQSEKYWLSQSLYSKGMIALYLNKYDKKTVAQDIVKSLKEFSITKDELGMYWKENTAGYFWYQRPIETQALMIEVFSEISKNPKDVENLKIWLLKQKQTQDWKTSKATVEAVYALLMKGANWLESDKLVDIKIGEQSINPNNIEGVKVEAGTGYFKTSWQANEIKPEMGKIKLKKQDKGIAWGALYWQYFEDLDKITDHKTKLHIDKKLFIERITNSGKLIEPISNKTQLKIGDKVIVHIEIRTDRDMEYVHLKDMRASGFEPINVVSRYKYQGGIGYYESTKDVSSNFFISYLRKGTYVFEYLLRVSHKGDFSNGISTIQCMYAPEFSSHSEGVKVRVK